MTHKKTDEEEYRGPMFVRLYKWNSPPYPYELEQIEKGEKPSQEIVVPPPLPDNVKLPNRMDA